MKKKDLEIGTVYANRRGHAYLLISTQIWSYHHWDRSWSVSRFTTPAAAQGISLLGRGVLCLSGSAEGLREWVLEHSALLDHSNDLDSTDDAQESTQRLFDSLEFIKMLHDSLPAESNFRITAQDYRQWPDTYEKTKTKLEKERQLKGAERGKLRAEAAVFEERAEAISKALNERGVELSWGNRTMGTLQGEHGQSVGYCGGYKLDLDDLERLLGIKTEEN